MKRLDDFPTNPIREYYHTLLSLAFGRVLDVGKSRHYDYGYETLDISRKLKPTIVGDICNAPIPDETYDTVLCNGVYQEASDPKKMLSEIHRILKPNGIAILGFNCNGYKPYKTKGEWKCWYKYHDEDYLKTLFEIESTAVFGNTFIFYVVRKPIQPSEALAK
jgi:SAM-dependent methyltransferase